MYIRASPSIDFAKSKILKNKGEINHENIQRNFY